MVRNDDSKSDKFDGRTVDKAKEQKSAPWPIITIGIVGTVLFLATIAVVWLQFFTLGKTMVGDTIDRSEWRSGNDVTRPYYRDDSTVSRTVIHGVISAVDGDTLTVIGDGKQTTIKRMETTIVRGTETDDVAKNDTVIVYGRKNDDGSVTAGRIIVSNGMYDMPMRDRQPRGSSMPSA